MDRRPGRRNPVHLCRHQARKRPHGLVFPEPRHRKGRCGDADPQAPLRVLVLDSGAAQAGRGGDPGNPPADQKGRSLPLQYGRDQGHRRGGRAGDHRSHCGGHARKPHHRTARQRGSRGPRRVSRFPRRHRKGGSFRAPGAGERQRRRDDDVFHLGNDRRAEDGGPRLHLSAGTYHHGAAVAQPPRRQPAPDDRRHGVGQGRVGQTLRAVAGRGLPVRLRPREVHARGHAAQDRAVPHHVAVRASDGRSIAS